MARVYYRPVVYDESMKLTLGEYQRLTADQVRGDAYIPLNRRQKLRMRWLNRSNATPFRWIQVGDAQVGAVRGKRIEPVDVQVLRKMPH